MDAVLSTPELVENILLFLDIRCLLVSCSRVCKIWCSIMEQSPAIQRALFFKPIPPDPSGDVEAFPILNPLLVKAFTPCFFNPESDRAQDPLHRAISFYHMPWTPRSRALRPLRTHPPPSLWPATDEHDNEVAYHDNDIYPMEMDRDMAHVEETSRNRFTRHGASWRRMLVSQPPPHALGYLEMNETKLNDIYSSGEYQRNIWTAIVDPITPDYGLRMGQLYDLVQYRTGHHDSISTWFRVIWHVQRGPPMSDFSQDAADKMMAHTGVVVEFYEESNPFCRRDPLHAEGFDSVFRSHDFKLPVVKTERKTIEFIPRECNHITQYLTVWLPVRA